ncbi:MAG TPA: aspartate kinase, partial [Bacillota bacterium]|nr:aspartate kinase [Bacillota bacterium]
MPLKVVKFGGTSLADAAHFRRVASIIKADPARRFIVPSAPGKRFPADTKITDLFYRCYDQIRSGESIDVTYGEIVARYN